MLLLSRSAARKIVATGIAAVAFAFLYEVTTLDSRDAARQAELRRTPRSPAPGAPACDFTATAYCKGTTTASGVNVRTGIAAADPDLLPVGSVIQVDRLGDRYNGIYTVMDTGPAVQGRHIDIYMWSCNEALAVRPPAGADLTVLRLGWNPRASTPSLVDRLFRSAAKPQPQRRRQLARPAAELPPARSGRGGSTLPAAFRPPLPDPGIAADTACSRSRAAPAAPGGVPASRSCPLCSTRILSMSWIVDEPVGDGDRRAARHQHAAARRG